MQNTKKIADYTSAMKRAKKGTIREKKKELNRVVECKICHKKFFNDYGLKQHSLAIHDMNNPPPSIEEIDKIS